jgi:delta 1-pyrroline-5-carboxylate dehydrogenase
MSMETVNPVTGNKIRQFDLWNDAQVEDALQQLAQASPDWRETSFADRSALMRAAAAELRARNEHYAGLITLEMGKLAREAKGEVEKCAWVCEYYADHAESFLADEAIETDAGKSYVAYLPLGTVLAVMPWNFPFWQVFRFAAPGLMAGNTAALKHASNVPQCALAIEEVFERAGFPKGVFRTLMISASQVEKVIEDPRVHAVTLTGSEPAGRKVAGTAGAQLKKSVLELGGSDAFVILDDADLDEAAKVGTSARLLNCGQSCIAAKRFIVVDAVADDFLEKLKAQMSALKIGDPTADDTGIGPMARQGRPGLRARGRTRLLLCPVRTRSRAARHACLDRGTVRASRHLHPRARRRGRPADRQRQPIRSRRQRMDPGRGPRGALRPAHGIRLQFRQWHGEERPAPSLRRDQGLGLRSRAGGPRDPRVREREDRVDQIGRFLPAH